MRVAACLVVVSLLPLAAVASPDCERSDVARMVCADAGLSALDRRTTELYTRAVLRSEDRPGLVAAQRGWMQSRDACADSAQPRACIADSYRTRIAELQIHSGLVMAPRTVEFACDDDRQPLTVAFYNDIDPRAAVLTWGDDQVIALQAPSGSGIHYSTRGVDYREHQGEVDVDFHGTALKCRPLR